MPYIRQIEREALNKHIDIMSKIIEHDGQLNYVISKLCHNWIKKVGMKYTRLNQIIGVLECAKLEFYRMVCGPYENGKQIDNGSVSDLDRVLF